MYHNSYLRSISLSYVKRLLHICHGFDAIMDDSAEGLISTLTDPDIKRDDVRDIDGIRSESIHDLPDSTWDYITYTRLYRILVDLFDEYPPMLWKKTGINPYRGVMYRTDIEILV